MSEPFLAEIIMFGGNFAPRGWAFCQGQIFSIAQNTALFSLLGTTFGGNGQTTFGLPDFRGRVPVGTGPGSPLPQVQLGEMAGSPTHTLIQTEMPAHVHQFAVPISTSDATAKNPSGNVPGATANPIYAAANTINGTGGTGNTNIAGGSQPFSITQPYLGMNFIICVEGIYPSRN